MNAYKLTFNSASYHKCLLLTQLFFALFSAYQMLKVELLLLNALPNLITNR